MEEPLTLEDAPALQDNQPCFVEGKTMAHQGPRLSPSTLCKDGAIGKMVQNTFIHTALPPITPPPGAPKRRSQSVPRNTGSDKDSWESACHALGFLPHSVKTDDSTAGSENQEFSSFEVSTPSSSKALSVEGTE